MIWPALLVLPLVACLPLEDTPEVAAAKAEFAVLFAAAEAGEHAALAPVNSDVQAPQIPAAYLDDAEEVAAAKEAFKAAFAEAEAGGLAAKQAPAPVHKVPEPTGAVALPSFLPFHLGSFHLPYTAYAPYIYSPHYVGYGGPHHPVFGLHGLPTLAYVG